MHDSNTLSTKGPSLPHATSNGAATPVTVVLPAFNEALAVGPEIHRIRDVLARAGIVHEILVVDDGSNDETVRRALEAGARVLQHVVNRGYGASLKAGILAASHDVIVITDADGTYPPEAIPALLTALGEADMVVGARTGAHVSIPLVRRPAKWLLGLLANQIAGRKIPDLNSGLRCFRRPTVLPYFSLLSNRFSFTTTITLAFLGDDYHVVYLPVDYHKRTGQSKIRPWHFMEFIILVLRMAMLFQPLRVFLPIAVALGAAGLAKAGTDIAVFLSRGLGGGATIFNSPVLSTSALLLLSASLQLGVLGLVADGVIRRIAQQRGPLPESHAMRVIEPSGPVADTRALG